MHAFMTAVLLGMAGPDPLNGDSYPQPPYRKLRELKQAMRRGKGNAVVGADGTGQAAFVEQALKGGKGELFSVGFQGFTEQQVARGVVGDRQRIAIAPVTRVRKVLSGFRITRNSHRPRASARTMVALKHHSGLPLFRTRWHRHHS